MTDIDLLQSPALQSAFPGLCVAFDEAAVQTYLQDALLDTNLQRYTISATELEEATYFPGDCCILRYRIEVQDQTSGRSSRFVVSARVFPNETLCAAYLRDRLVPLIPLVAGRPEVAPFVRPVAGIEPLHMAVYAFPIDGELPALAAATDPRQVAAILNQSLPDSWKPGGEIETCRIELVDYRRQFRAILRYILDGPGNGSSPAAESILYGKLAADASGAMAGQITSALRECVQRRSGAHGFDIPHALAYRPDLHLSLLGSIPGKPAIHQALKQRLRGKPSGSVLPDALSPEEMVEKCAYIAATIHGSGIGMGVARPLNSEILWLRRQIAEVQRISPHLALRLNGWLEQVLRDSGSPAQDSRFCHGDFTPGQVLFEGSRSGLVDFDSVCQAEPALDLGQFLVYIRMACMKAAGAATPEAGALADRLGGRFLAAYAEAAPHRVNPPDLIGRSRVYKMVSLLRRTIQSWRKFKPQRVEAAISALEEETYSAG